MTPLHELLIPLAPLAARYNELHRVRTGACTTEPKIYFEFIARYYSVLPIDKLDKLSQIVGTSTCNSLAEYADNMTEIFRLHGDLNRAFKQLGKRAEELSILHKELLVKYLVACDISYRALSIFLSQFKTNNSRRSSFFEFVWITLTITCHPFVEAAQPSLDVTFIDDKALFNRDKSILKNATFTTDVVTSCSGSLFSGGGSTSSFKNPGSAFGEAASFETTSLDLGARSIDWPTFGNLRFSYKKINKRKNDDNENGKNKRRRLSE